MNRHDNIRDRLAELQEQGYIGPWYAQGGMPGKRWVLGYRAFNTSEVEAFILGAKAVIFNAPELQEEEK